MSELIDLVDLRGEIVKPSVARDDVENYNGLYMQIVIAVIRNTSGDVLVHQRAKSKKVNGGDVDHVCGGILSGESPQDAAMREAQEEVGVVPKNLAVVRKGINSYGRYCFLLHGESDELPATELDPLEVEWAAYLPLAELLAKNESGELTFVDGFFEDMDKIDSSLLTE